MAEPAATLGRYQLLGVLGRGGFATVYRAHDPQLDRDVALKTLLPHLAEDAGICRRFLAEARAIARLSHPGIITVFEAGEANGRPFYAMEVIEGRTLAEELAATGPLPPARALGLLRPLAAALDYLHGAGLVHRDVKPANIMLHSDGRVLLMDFGIARVLEETRYTETGASLGTPSYMSPEQVLGHDVGPPADVYMLAIIAYQMLAGRPPFSGATAQVLHAQAYEPPPALSGFAPGLPDYVYQALEVALSKDPAARPPSATHLVEQLAGNEPVPAPALNATVESSESQPPVQVPTVAPEPPRVAAAQSADPLASASPAPSTAQRRRLPGKLLVGAGVAAVLIAAGVGFVLVLANRGGGGASQISGGAAQVGAATLQQVATDNRYSLSRIQGQVGQTINVGFRNDGQHQHSLRLVNLRDGNGTELHTAVLPHGGSATLSFNVDRPGTWTFRCDVYPNEMNGTVVVQ